MSCVDTYDQEDDHQHSEKNVCSLELFDLSPVLPQFLRERFRLEPRLVVQGFHLEADNSLTLRISTNIATIHETNLQTSETPNPHDTQHHKALSTLIMSKQAREGNYFPVQKKFKNC